MEQYIRKIIYSDLNKKNVERILKTLRKLNWDDKEVIRIYVLFKIINYLFIIIFTRFIKF